MAKVYTGKVIIPGDQVEAYFKVLKAAEQARAPFRAGLERLRNAFYDHLCQHYSERTANKHAGTVQMFIEFLCGYTDVERLEDVTRGMANSQCRRGCRKKVWDNISDTDIKVGLRRFVECLARYEGIENPKALVGLQ